MCLFLAALMVGGVAYSIIVSLARNVSAASNNTYIRVGLQYGSSATSTVTLSSSTGFELGTLDSGYNFTPFKTITDTSVRLSCASGDVSMSTSIAIQKTNKTLIYGNPKGAVYIRPVNESKGNYITFGSNKYAGIIQVTRQGNKLVIVNLLEMEQYIMGVLPYEVYTTWPAETLKAFSIVVRSYTKGSLGRHSSDGFDLCATSHCQVYKGRNLVTLSVESAVKATKGLVIKYKGKIVPSYYSDSTGGVTASAHDTWGSNSSYDYLKAIATPWEKYADRSRGAWETVYTPKELYSQLHSKGYFNASTGSVSSVKITKFCTNSSYVYSAQVTSAAGETVTISRADKIRSAFGLYSANFVVGKGGSTVTRTDYVLGSVSKKTPYTVQTQNSKVTVEAQSSMTVATSSGNKSISAPSELTVLTAYGKFGVPTSTVTSAEPTLNNLVSGSKIAKTVNVKLGGSSSNFVFSGRGWGHGVGFSQWGMKDLADLGANYKQIISAYLSDVTVESIY